MQSSANARAWRKPPGSSASTEACNSGPRSYFELVAVKALQDLKAWARRIKRDVVALWLAARDPRVPVAAKVAAAIIAAYALSPIDLIPDFIPILGYLDDVILVPLGIALAVRMIPAPLMQDLRERASAVRKPRSTGGLVAVVVLWLVAAAVIYHAVFAQQ